MHPRDHHTIEPIKLSIPPSPLPCSVCIVTNFLLERFSPRGGHGGMVAYRDGRAHSVGGRASGSQASGWVCFRVFVGTRLLTLLLALSPTPTVSANGFCSGPEWERWGQHGRQRMERFSPSLCCLSLLLGPRPDCRWQRWGADPLQSHGGSGSCGPGLSRGVRAADSRTPWPRGPCPCSPTCTPPALPCSMVRHPSPLLSFGFLLPWGSVTGDLTVTVFLPARPH